MKKYFDIINTKTCYKEVTDMVNSITTGIIQNPYNSYTNGYSGTIGTDTDVENQNGFKRVVEDEDRKSVRHAKTESIRMVQMRQTYRLRVQLMYRHRLPGQQ